MPTSVKIVTLQKTVTSGQKTYPLYIGFLSAEDIAKIADAPAFTHATPNREIANSILTPPVTQWQRPLNETRVSRIQQLFNGTGEFMPNPVLLSESVPSHGNVSVSQRAVAGVPTGMYEVEVAVTDSDQPKPLWILDGQHRINGLAKSAQKGDPVPFVLLLNQSGAHYSGPDLAKIFAQVTTTAEQLDDLHDEWLTFAFNLRSYGPPNPNEQRHRDSMTTVAHLCRWPQIPGGGNKANPFFDHIQFNHYKPRTTPDPGGFSYSCLELKDLIYTSYYSQPPVGGQHLSPSELAGQFLLFHDALRQVVLPPQNESVFFGDANHGQRIMQDAVITGCMAHLLQHGIPVSWAGLLNQLNFSQTAWDFSSWTVSLSGANVSSSKKVATRVFVEAFRNMALQPGTNNLGDYLQGDKAKVVFQAYSLKPNGRIDPSTLKEFSVDGGSVKTENIAPRTHVKLKGMSSNVAMLRISDRQSPPGRLVEYQGGLKPGMQLNPQAHTKPLQLLVTLGHYGGVRREASLTITW
jgi:hypothetical protein